MDSSTTPSYVFNHPTLGEIKGRLISAPGQASVVHFRSIPYATVPARFKQSILLDHLPDQFDERPKGDFTNYGAACPQMRGGDPFAFHGGKLPDDHDIQYNEFTCLTLSMSVPLAVLENSREKPLPVMVYVHGGGLTEGVAHVDGLHESTKMVALSAQEDMPVIMVNIGYRLHFLGFLICSDLIEEWKANGTSASEDAFNMGLWDQRKAFQWVQQQISGFGGDPSNVTAFGESAGSISLVYHLSGNEPLFRRAILQSGGPWGTSTLAENDEAYARLLERLTINAPTAKERLEALRKIPIDELAPRMDLAAALFPYFGPETTHLFPRGIANYSNQFQLVKDCPWIEDLIIGADQLEGDVLMPALRGGEAGHHVPLVKASLGETMGTSLLAEYDIEADMDANLFWLNFSTMAGDLILTEPTHSMANILSQSEIPTQTSMTAGEGKRRRRIYHYFICLRNPFPGSPQYSVAGPHAVELLFLFLTLQRRYPKHRNRFLERQAVEMARRWIAFGNGKEPWAEYVPVSAGGEGKVAICDDLHGWITRTREEDERESANDPWGPRRYKALDLLREAFAQLEKLGELHGQDLVNQVRRQALDVPRDLLAA